MKPENYKEIFWCMAKDTFDSLKSEQMHEGRMILERIMNTVREYDEDRESSPGKTQDGETPPQNTDKGSDVAPSSGAEEEACHSSGQGHP